MKRFTVLFSLLPALLLATASAGSKVDPRLAAALPTLAAGERIPVWVFFTDKGGRKALRSSVPASVVSERSLLRRAKVRPAGLLVDTTDLPVEESYIRVITGANIAVRERSRWMNGISVSATAEQVRFLETLPFVRSVEQVGRYRRTPGETAAIAAPSLSPPPEGTTSFNYGASFNQVNQIGVPAVHDRGNTAQGVVIGVFDNGFRLLTHEAFDTLRPRILATYDFVDHKVSVVPNNPSSSFGDHGVNTLSTIGGFRSGQLIGPAFGASYILARTENDSSETPFEEDKWVAAIEWADSIGVDVTSTSLGYLTYDAPYPSWTWQDMNGNTTVITRAADMAVGRGILVVNSAGNDGDNTSHNTLGAPADGDSVFTIGAVTSTGTRSSFSSVGPTTSVPPRIKPDAMAQGSSVRVASAILTTGYGTASGTSFSCPLAAGVAALMIHARPTDPPMAIITALRSTASRASSPDNRYGWGILNAVAALTPSPSAPVAPPNGAPDRDTAVALFWSASRWASSYRLQVAADPGFTTLVLNDSTVTDTTHRVTGLASGTTYYWRVAARNIYGTSASSAGWAFSTSLNPPPSTTLVSPVDGATGIPVATTLIWDPAPHATRYRIRLAADSLMASPLIVDSAVTTPFRAVSGLPHAATVYWRVEPGNGAGWGPTTTAWRFTTVTAPPAPLQIAPADSATEVAAVLSLAWHGSPGASAYEVRLSLHSDLSAPVIADSSITDTLLAIGPLDAGVSYYWAVRSRIPVGAGPWSSTRLFTISSAATRSIDLSTGWNLVSLPLEVRDPSAATLFPSAVSPPFLYAPGSGYLATDSLATGSACWIKSADSNSVILSGTVVLSDSIPVLTGWNMVGMISVPLDTAAVGTLPAGIRSSGFYSYSPAGGYQSAGALEPGRGYWVKCASPGIFVLARGAAAEGALRGKKTGVSQPGF